MLNAVFGRSVFGNILFGYGMPAPEPVISLAPPDRTFLPVGALQSRYKTPDDILNYTFTWAQEIPGDVIVKSTWISNSADVIILYGTIDSTGLFATVLLSGGVNGNNYAITNQIVTEYGLEIEATFQLFVVPYIPS